MTTQPRDMARDAALAELARQLSGRLLPGEPLSRHTTYATGGAAELLIVPASAEELARALEFCEAHGLPWRVLGAGSNLLVSDRGVAGVVFKLRGTLEELKAHGERVVAGAGLMLPRLVVAAAREGLSGLEYLAGIPGTVGGALAMNAGAHGHDIGGCVRSVTFWETGAGVRQLGREELGFAYRDSLLKHGRRVALGAEFELARGERGAIEGVMSELLARRKATQPIGERSAGCVFRNPPGAFAGALIERAGLKGTRLGGAEISTRHANFIVNTGGATAADIKALMELVRERVRETAGVELAPEITIWDD
jgi:UDP-N-acetylmuramate dehydrogenase